MASPRLLFTLAFCLLLQACATPDLQLSASATLAGFGDSSRFGTRPGIPTPDDVHRLTPEQEADFLGYYHDPSRAEMAPYYRLFHYLDAMTLDFQYADATLIATDTLATNSGNCLSLAILTTALARLVDLQIGYKLMDDQPVFEYEGTVVRRGLHLSSMIYNPEWIAAGKDATNVYARGAQFDYFPAVKRRFVANITSEEYLALYYSNIASDAIIASDYDTAYWYVLEALQYAPDHGGSLSMLAVVNRRTGDVATAEAIYRYGITHAKDKLGLLKNYHTLLAFEGRTAEAEQIRQQLDAMDDPSPFHWLQLARESHAAAEWDDAIAYYRRALQRAPYLHEAYLGLAQSYYAAGRLQSAEQALIDAAGSANRVSTRTLYEAKLATLRKEI